MLTTPAAVTGLTADAVTALALSAADVAAPAPSPAVVVTLGLAYVDGTVMPTDVADTFTAAARGILSATVGGALLEWEGTGAWEEKGVRYTEPNVTLVAADATLSGARVRRLMSALTALGALYVQRSVAVTVGATTLTASLPESLSAEDAMVAAGL